METRRLGRLGHESSVLIYGAAALGEVDQDTADRSIEEALAAGINHVDVAAGYGEAEVRLGAMMDELRPQVFLATKTDERGAEEAWAGINRSLERLQTDRVDLIQLHAVGDRDELDKVTMAGGALESAVRAQEEGLVGAVGITGHGPEAAATHLEALSRYPFATVLTPLNAVLWRGAGFRVAFEALLSEVRAQDAGLMTIKTVARRNWPGVAEGDEIGQQPFATWYEPISDDATIRAAVSWVLGHEFITGLATPGDVRLLGAVIAAEADRLELQEAERLLGDVADYSSPFAELPAGL